MGLADLRQRSGKPTRPAQAELQLQKRLRLLPSAAVAPSSSCFQKNTVSTP
jgi:hypothetical protein